MSLSRCVMGVAVLLSCAWQKLAMVLLGDSNHGRDLVTVKFSFRLTRFSAVFNVAVIGFWVCRDTTVDLMNDTY